MDSSSFRVPFWPASLASTSTSSPGCGDLGEWRERISPDAWHRGDREREILPVEEVRPKRRRVEEVPKEETADEMTLDEMEQQVETEQNMEKEAIEEFAKRMREEARVERDNLAWSSLFKEVAESRF